MRYVELENWSRRETYEHYRQVDYPHFQLTATVDISEFRTTLVQRSASFSVGVVYLLARAANEIPAFRLRIRDDQVVEHDRVHPSFTVLLEDERLSFCMVVFDPDYQAFSQAAQAGIRQVRERPVLEDEPGQDDVLYMTGIPWVSFTSVLHPIHMHPPDSVPRLAWGRFFEEHGRLRMPLSVQVNHALMDGLHVGRYFERVEALLSNPQELLA
jgi:chloramphenicol O-acetyltransferase type A